MPAQQHLSLSFLVAVPVSSISASADLQGESEARFGSSEIRTTTFHQGAMRFKWLVFRHSLNENNIMCSLKSGFFNFEKSLPAFHFHNWWTTRAPTLQFKGSNRGGFASPGRSKANGNVPWWPAPGGEEHLPWSGWWKGPLSHWVHWHSKFKAF